MTIEQRAVDTIRVLSMDAVQKANSGHPGMPMGMADIGFVIWSKFLNLDPAAPTWRDRDRFVVSNGHGSMLLYSLLHLSGFPLSMDEIEHFRQWGYETAGHPEYNPDVGIETTTGPLGQGFGTAVGMAIAEEHLRAVHGNDLTDHRTFVLCGDGDLMEGVSSEAASLAGHLGLGRIVVYYDNNSITIDGSTDLAFTEDVSARFAAYGWQTLSVDGHDREAIEAATRAALSDTERPTLIACKTHIGFGAPTKVDTSAAHGSPLGPEEIVGAKEAMGWDLEPFTVPDDVYGVFAQAMTRGTQAHAAWRDRVERIASQEPERFAAWERVWDPGNVVLDPPDAEARSKIATRKLSEAVIQQLSAERPDVVGGSADLVPSNNTYMKASTDFSRADRTGRNVRYGIREHAMGAAVNGMTQHGGVRGFGATFLTFSDYMRPSVRLAALMGVPSIFVWTHDSFFLGQDGPTHQPIEHITSLRLIPGLHVHRPADPSETAVAWQQAINRSDGPSAIILTRQGLEVPATPPATADIERGGYVRVDGSDAIVVATGSEVPLAEAAAQILTGEDISLRVVSMPCTEIFTDQDDAYRDDVLGPDMPVFTLEAGSTMTWKSMAANGGIAIGIDHFGASAPAEVLAEQYGFTPETVAATIEQQLGRTRS
ncbi:MAG: transketolase [Acidimicrobiia bacterium]|nr:MAG: transketolase [Acidimicrobiia bacterium]